MAAGHAFATVFVLFLAACSGATSASPPPDPPGCSGYRPVCISGDSVCSVDSSGCRICTCQSRIGTETAPDLFVPGTSAPAPPMSR